MTSFVTYLKNVRAELSHVVWPTKRQSLTHLALIILIAAITAVLIAILDHFFTKGVGFLIS
ncbi:MAG: SecE/Sec61-gamma subunit of protein translocation complex [Candidatus Parcubacteria bacterium]|jgi:preprotein translocase SecE subunit|nr:SecE/Sec61-gamma subunit of protein translocation complex [Candidatus Parcubacteria bacterium]